MTERQISGIELCQRLRNKIDKHPCGCETRWDEALWRSIDLGRCEHHQGVRAALDAPVPGGVAARKQEAGEDECACFVTPESTWLSAASCGYGSGYEPGSQMEFNPECPVHGDAAPPAVPADGAGETRGGR